MKSRIFMLALALPMALGVLFAACGGDDDDDDDGGDSGSGSSVQTGSDEKYVADMCKAYNTYATALTKAMLSIEEKDSEDAGALLKAFVGPMEDFAKAYAKMKPPADIKDWHVSSAKALSDQVKALKDAKDLSAFENIGESPVGDMPAGAEERLTKLADKNKDCAAVGGLFGE